MFPLITTQLKDETLQWLCANVRPGRLTQIDLPELLEATGVDEEIIEVVLGDFSEMGLLSDLNPMRQGFHLILKVKAHDLLQRGGFEVMDALNEANIQKILLELENLQKQLKPDQVDTINKITAIASSLATVVAAFHTKS